jgi:hypothetical protein
MQSSDPALSRYYELVGEMQKNYGQELNVGPFWTQVLQEPHGK